MENNNASTPNQNPYPAKPEGKSKKVALGIGAVVLIKYGLKFGLAFLIGAGFTAAEIERSKTEPWPEEFKKAFIEGCVAKDVGPGSAELFCSCMTAFVENKHIIATKYNANDYSEAEYGDHVAQEIGKLLETPEGDEEFTKCEAVAATGQSDDKRIPASKSK